MRHSLPYCLRYEQKTEFLIARIAESFGTLRDSSSFLERVINMAIDFTMSMRGDLSLFSLICILRVLQEGNFERLGSAKQIHSDFRIIAATNKDLQAEVEKGTFRQDLFFRLNAFSIEVPPLRARKEDIPHLAQHFLGKYTEMIRLTLAVMAFYGFSTVNPSIRLKSFSS